MSGIHLMADALDHLARLRRLGLHDEVLIGESFDAVESAREFFGVGRHTDRACKIGGDGADQLRERIHWG